MSAQFKMRFVSSNQFKVAEAQEIPGKHNIRVVASAMKIEELQTKNTSRPYEC